MNSRIYHCDFCGKEISNVDSYIKHRRGHIPPKRPKCRTCDTTIDSRLFPALKFMWYNGVSFFPSDSPTHSPLLLFNCPPEKMVRMCGPCLLKILSNTHYSRITREKATVILDLEHGADQAFIAKSLDHSPSWVSDTVRSFEEFGLLSFVRRPGRSSAENRAIKKFSLEDVEWVFEPAYNRVLGSSDSLNTTDTNLPKRIVNDPLLRRIFKYWVVRVLKNEYAWMGRTPEGESMRKRLSELGS